MEAEKPRCEKKKKKEVETVRKEIAKSEKLTQAQLTSGASAGSRPEHDGTASSVGDYLEHVRWHIARISSERDTGWVAPLASYIMHRTLPTEQPLQLEEREPGLTEELQKSEAFLAQLEENRAANVKMGRVVTEDQLKLITYKLSTLKAAVNKMEAEKPGCEKNKKEVETALKEIIDSEKLAQAQLPSRACVGSRPERDGEAEKPRCEKKKNKKEVETVLKEIAESEKLTHAQLTSRACAGAHPKHDGTAGSVRDYLEHVRWHMGHEASNGEAGWAVALASYILHRSVPGQTLRLEEAEPGLTEELQKSEVFLAQMEVLRDILAKGGMEHAFSEDQLKLTTYKLFRQYLLRELSKSSPLQ